ncbi:MFS transporter [Mucilaginibacter antarcticus]|uniref:MFS transporter n=1 Tax=Mucilaginibacter antarcticus TaxID=1855725 RepID=UPI00362B0C42
MWFAGNAIMGDIARQLHLDAGYLAHLTSAVQLGFISGTLLFAILSVADRFSPVKVFFCCAMIAAAINLGASINDNTATTLLIFRFATGFFLAGIYPVGMKIASDHYQQGLGRSLGFLVGALVLGTAFPHLLKSMTAALPWRYVIYATSALAVIGGIAMLVLVPDGPGHAKGQQLNVANFLHGFRNSKFRAAAFGYFGHMWEVYAFWAFIPLMIGTYQAQHQIIDLNVPLWSFAIIASGSLSCALGGVLSQRFGAKPVATIALFISCLCCLMSPLFLVCNMQWAFIVFIFIWGMAVAADSPLFSTLIAQNAPVASRGSSLTIVNSIGFAITIISIQFINALRTPANAYYIYMLLAIGPVLGLLVLRRERGESTAGH